MMVLKEYPKIQSIFKRDEKTKKFIPGEFSLPVFEYLQDNTWIMTEKIDGMNIRVGWNGERPYFGGRTRNAQIPTFLYEKLNDIFLPKIGLMKEVFAIDEDEPFPYICIYGEGYGAKIQKGGGNYIPDGVDFIVFDIQIGEWWLEREAVENISSNLGLDVVPIRMEGAIFDGVRLIKDIGLASEFGYFWAEGLVLRPKEQLFTRDGKRVITKIKHKDF